MLFFLDYRSCLKASWGPPPPPESTAPKEVQIGPGPLEIIKNRWEYIRFCTPEPTDARTFFMKIINPPGDWYTFGQARFGSFSSAFSATSLEPSVLPIKSDIDSNNQLEITTTVFSEHRCRIWFLRVKSDMCLRRGAVRLQKALRRLLEALFSDIEFTLVFTYQSPPRGPQGFERKPPWATPIHHQAATRRHIPHKAPKDLPKGTRAAPKMPKRAPRKSFWSPFCPRRPPR